MKQSFYLFLMVAVFAISSCHNPDPANAEVYEEAFNNQEMQYAKINWPKITFFSGGVTIQLWKASTNCTRSLAFCKINSFVINFDWTTRSVPSNIGISENNELVLEFKDGIDIPAYAGQNYFDIEAGDEIIDIDPDIVTEFSDKGIDISTMELRKGRYDFVLNPDTGNYYVIVPMIL